jgi:hypothetical protein
MHHLELAVGQCFVPRPFGGRIQAKGQALGQIAADVPPAADHFADGFDQFLRRLFFS